MPEPQFHWQVRVYYEDTDSGGVVYYANYLKFFERARTEWLRALGWGQQALAEEHGRQFVVAAANINYQRPARLDDLIDLKIRVVRVGRASLTFEQTALRDGVLLAHAHVKIGCIALASFTPAAMPIEMVTTMKLLKTEAGTP
ncbi:MAG: tol-pal system-associated acyl-CoA thioesterase [Burkholderiaceae bacterium]